MRRTRRTASKLDREAVIDAALDLADQEGLESVTFRRLADQFGVTPMALYWHFDDKEALLGALADRLWVQTADSLRSSLAELDVSDDSDGWLQLRLTLASLLAVMRRHPPVAELVPTRVMECEAGLEMTELTLAFLARKGFSIEQASKLARFVLASAVMLVTTQPGIEIAGADERAAAQRRKQIALASLPPERYPHITASAPSLTDCDSSEDYFTVGFDAIVAGVTAQAPLRGSDAVGDEVSAQTRSRTAGPGATAAEVSAQAPSRVAGPGATAAEVSAQAPSRVAGPGAPQT